MEVYTNKRQLLCLLTFLLPALSSAQSENDLLKPETVERRRLTRFQVGHEDNNLCWERHERDGFITPIDAHNHFRPFYGPAVPWDTYMDWMRSHGILFTTMLAANGFFANGKRVTEAVINNGDLDGFFTRMEDMKWPVTLHCDLGCDQYDSVPWKQGCFVPPEELDLAKAHKTWWQDFLGPYYRGFFDATGTPKQNFKKIQHLKIWDTLLTRYPKMIVVWAHLGLSKELKYLHPTVHVHIIQKLMDKHRNLHADTSWDVLAKQLFMNYDGRRNASHLHHDVHEDFQMEVKKSIVDTAELHELRNSLEEQYGIHEDMVKTHGSVTGPTHAMAIYLEMFHHYADRFVTGTDFVSSFGPKEQYPGTKPGNGCVKDKKNHARQVTDTSTFAMFLNDEAFQKIVLGSNYFRINRLQHTFTPPPVCGDSVLSNEAIVGIGVGAGVLVVVALVIAAVLICARSSDETAFIRVGGGSSATTNV